jgi:mediator of RNA polymerase II transcription subunit 1
MTMEALMERLRAKADSQKSLVDTSKIVRMGMANRSHSLDIVDKAVLRGCLDTLQDSISVRSVAGMSERLETIARKMGLKFNHHGTTFYISTETFYLEVRMDQAGTVVETKIHHQSVERSTNSHHLEQTAPEISECLTKGDFGQFTLHLEGLIAVYAIPNCSALDKARAWQALYHLERDLERAGGRHAWIQDLGKLVQQAGGLGLVQARAGGQPMRLTYFLPPYELLDQESGTIRALTAATLTEGKLGFSATLALRPSATPYLLPLSSLLQGTEWYSLTKSNAVPMPAHPSLNLSAPMPMCWSLICQLAAVTGVDWLEETANSPLLSLVTRQASEGVLDPANNRGLFVTLPDQQHCYFLTETPSLVGQLVEYVPFRHPQQVSAIVAVLRAQAQFNTLIGSCVRTNSLEDVDTSVMMEVTCLDSACSSLSVTFEHPTEEVIATAELDLKDLTAPRCRVYTSSVALCPEETADRALQRSLSIPVTMRTVINRTRGEARGSREEPGGLPVGGHGTGLGGGSASQQDGAGDQKVGGLGGRVKMSPGGGAAVSGTPAVCDPGGGGPPGGLKLEPMDTEPSAEALNREGLQATGSQPGAPSPVRAGLGPDPTFRHPSLVSDKAPGSKSENRRRSDSSKPEAGEAMEGTGGLSVSVSSRGPLSDNGNRPHRGQGPPSSPSKEGRSGQGSQAGVRPNVSITPISDAASLGEEAGSSRGGRGSSTGIEIIPLGQGGATGQGQLKSKVRDLKRSLSEDDKRRLDKKEKRKREEKALRQGRESPGKGGEGKSKLLGVIERLSGQGGDCSLELKPGGPREGGRGVEPGVQITLDR